MPKSSSDRLAQALRANLKRRKAAAAAQIPATKTQAPVKTPEKAADAAPASPTPPPRPRQG